VEERQICPVTEFDLWGSQSIQWLSYRLGSQGSILVGGRDLSPFTTMSSPALGPTQPHIKWVLQAFSLGTKWPGYKADHSPPSSTKIKECTELYLHSTIRLYGVIFN